ncbi:MAG: hypothetical protein ACI3XQ_11285 [Eubacteriales bacterium]
MENTSTAAAVQGSNGTSQSSQVSTSAPASQTQTTGGGTQTTEVSRKSGMQLLSDAFAGATAGSENSGEGASSANAEDQTEQKNTQPENSSTDEGTTDGAGEKAAQEAKKQTKEENAVYAKARRQAEAELKKHKDEFMRDIDASIANAGLIDPYTGKPVSDKKAFDAYLQHLRENTLDNDAKALGVTREQLDELARRHPDVIAARETERKAAEERQKAEREAASARFTSDIAEISKLNPDIKTFDDLKKLDKFDDIYDLIKTGYRPNHAYQIVYADQINQSIRANAEQAARNAVNGKSHLTKAQPSGEGQTEVPESLMQTMRELMPGKSDAELRKRALKYLK